MKAKKTTFIMKVIYHLIKNRLEIIWLLLIHNTPWYQAFIISVWNKYKESELYRLRWIEFSPEQSAELYSYKEHKLFAHHVKQDKKLMLKIIFMPYSILNNITIDDYLIRSHVVLK